MPKVYLVSDSDENKRLFTVRDEALRVGYAHVLYCCSEDEWESIHREDTRNGVTILDRFEKQAQEDQCSDAVLEMIRKLRVPSETKETECEAFCNLCPLGTLTAVLGASMMSDLDLEDMYAYCCDQYKFFCVEELDLVITNRTQDQQQ